MAETQALYEQALASGPLAHSVGGSAPSEQLVPVLDQLRQMQQHVAALHIQLAETIERLRRLVPGREEG